MDRAKNIDFLHPLVGITSGQCEDFPVEVTGTTNFVSLNNMWYAGGPLVETVDDEGEDLPPETGAVIFKSPNFNSWSQCPTPSREYTLSKYDSKLVIVGGMKPDKHEVINDLWTSTDGTHWEASLPPMPTGRANPLVVSVEDQKCLIVAGGYKNHVDSFHVIEVYENDQCSSPPLRECVDSFHVIEVYKGNQWYSLPPLPFTINESSRAVVHEGELYVLPSQGCIYHAEVDSILAAAREDPSPTFHWKKMKAPAETKYLASLGRRLIATGGQRQLFAYSPFSQSWIPVLNFDLYCMKPGHFVLCQLTSAEFFFSYTYLKKYSPPYGYVSENFHASLRYTKFDANESVEIGVLYRLEEMGIPVVSTLRKVYQSMSKLLNIDISSYDYTQYFIDDEDSNGEDYEDPEKEPWEIMLTMWIAEGYPANWKELMNNLVSCNERQLCWRIENFFGDFKPLQERCIHVIVSALLEQKVEDPVELCSKLPDYVPTVMRDNILDAFKPQWNRLNPSSSCSCSPSPTKKVHLSES